MLYIVFFIIIYLSAHPFQLWCKKKNTPLDRQNGTADTIAKKSKIEFPRATEAKATAKDKPIIKSRLNPKATPKQSVSAKTVKAVKQGPAASTTAFAPATLEQSVEDKAHELFVVCVDSTNKRLNWLDFCTQMAAILQKETKYHDLAEAFTDISTSSSITYITYKLWWYTDKMPPKTLKLYQQFSKAQLIDIITMRIALNPHPT